MTKLLIRVLLISVFLTTISASTFRVLAAPGNDTADGVLGQANYSTSGCDTGGMSGYTLCHPGGVAVDQVSGTVYIGDGSRVLVYLNPLSTGNFVADRVIGQSTFLSNECNAGGISAYSLCGAQELDVDDAGNLWVADQGNHRVLVYFSPLTTDQIADVVIGQPDFVTADCGVSATQICSVVGVDVDSTNTLWLGDSVASRVLGFNDPLGTDAVADVVLGQPDFTTGTLCPAPVSASSFCLPLDVQRSASGRLFVSDPMRNRVLAWDSPGTGVAADYVLGQSAFADETCNTGGIGPATMCTPWGLGTEGDTLFVADRLNNRVLRFDTIATGGPAAAVYGQGGSFTSNTCLPTSAETLCNPVNPEIDVSGNMWTAQGFDGDARRVTLHRSCADPLDPECDGHKNPQALLHLGPFNPLSGVDNCSTFANADQKNTDGNFIDHPLPITQDDKTVARSDAEGDGCDEDDDNDGLSDIQEASGTACGGTVTDPLNADTDANVTIDRALDGAECALGTNPTDFSSKPTAAQCASYLGVTTATDTDGDKIRDYVEFCYYNTDRTLTDTDGDKTLDGGKDGCEAASFNPDRIVNVADMGMLASAIASVLFRSVNLDVNKDGVWNPADQGIVASFISPSGQCPG